MEHTGLVYFLIVTTVVGLAALRSFAERKHKAVGYFRFMGGFEIALIALLLAALIFLGCLQIVLRNFFHRGIIWADPMMRHIVLWLGCLGGVLATKRLRHINIDVFSRLLPPALKSVRDKIIHLATALAASLLGLASLKLVVDEKAFGEKAFLGIDVWMLQAILPVAFLLITYRSVCNTFAPPRLTTVPWEGPLPPEDADAPDPAAEPQP